MPPSMSSVLRAARLSRHVRCNATARGLCTRPVPPSASSGKTSSEPTTPQGASPSQKAPPPSISSVLAQVNDQENSLLALVHIPEDPKAVLKSNHPARNILAESGIIVQRQIEMMNLFIGFEQANRYVILDPHGNHIGYIAEHDGGIGKTMTRQWFSTHRAFITHVFDKHGQEVLRFQRPFSWINSTIRVYDATEPAGHITPSSSTAMTPSQHIDQMQRVSSIPISDMRIIGEAQSQWAPLRRKYSLFLAHESGAVPTMSTKVDSKLSESQQKQTDGSQTTMAQFAYIDERFLSWDFSLLDADQKLIGSVNRSFRGFAREIFTDTGAYALRMDSAGLDVEANQQHIISNTNQGEKAYAEAVGGTVSQNGMTLDQRAIMLATAVTVDFDYFSRHSGHGGGFLPLWMMGGGGEAAGGAAGGAAAGGAAEAGAAEAGGAVIGGAGRAVGGAAGGIGAGEGAMAGAGTMAGYEAMQRGLGRDQAGDDASPQAPTDQPSDYQQPQSGFDDGQGGDVWGGDKDPWQGGSGEGGGGEGGGGILQAIWDSMFGD